MRRSFPGPPGGRCGESSGACPEWLRYYRPRLRRWRSVRQRTPRTMPRACRGGWVSCLIVSPLRIPASETEPSTRRRRRGGGSTELLRVNVFSAPASAAPRRDQMYRPGSFARCVTRLDAKIPNLDIQCARRVLHHGILARPQRLLGPDLVESARRQFQLDDVHRIQLLFHVFGGGYECQVLNHADAAFGRRESHDAEAFGFGELEVKFLLGVGEDVERMRALDFQRAFPV